MITTFKKAVKSKAIQLGFFTRPSFMIIGVEKGGTSALFQTLYKHPMLQPSAVKETKYFSTDQNFPTSDYFSYYQYFPISFFNDRKGFEATPAYLYNLNVAERIRSFNPEMKFIVSFRNPAHRMLSAWSMFHHFPRNHFEIESRTFEEVVETEVRNFNTNQEESIQKYISKGMYYEQVEEYLKHFPKENFLFLENTDLLYRPTETLKEIWDFIEVKPEIVDFEVVFKSKHDDKEQTYQSEIKILEDFFAPYNARLEKIIKRSFKWDTE